jgi:hypothetical protein
MLQQKWHQHYHQHQRLSLRPAATRPSLTCIDRSVCVITVTIMNHVRHNSQGPCASSSAPSLLQQVERDIEALQQQLSQAQLSGDCMNQTPILFSL